MYSIGYSVGKGKRLTLAPLYLSSLFGRLDECVGTIVRFVSHYDMVTHTDTSSNVHIAKILGCITKSA